MSSLSELSVQYPAMLRGSKRESTESLIAVEAALGVLLPGDLKTYLLELGYGRANAIANITRSIEDTERFRRAVKLPPHFVVLDDRNDAGAVLLDCSSTAGRVLWVATFALERLASAKLEAKNLDEFASFSGWVRYCIEELLDEPEA
jgi:hypothetical protein